MLTTHSRSQFVSKIFTDGNGRELKLTFLVALVNGELRGRLVSAEPISPARPALSGEVLDSSCCLPIFLSTEKATTAYVPEFAPIVSPYKELLFFTSQPTRAPSAK